MQITRQFLVADMVFTIKDYDLRDTFRIDKRALLFAGFYPRRSHKYNHLYFLGACINWFFSLSQLISMTIQMIIDRNDLSKLSESLQYYITLLTFVCKVVNFVVYKQTLLHIEDSLTLSNFYGFSDLHLKLLKKKIYSAQIAGKTFRYLSVAAVAMWGLMPYLDPGKSKSLPMPGWFPFNVTKYYHQTFIFQVLGIANTAYTDCSIDILSWVLISIASGQFQILKENLKSLNYANKDLKKVEQKFVRLVTHHKEIEKYVYKIETVFSKGIFLQFFASVIVICCTGFMMIIVPASSMQFQLLVTYFFCMMCQVAMYCWYGHDVMTTSNKIGQAFYMSNWYESDLKIRKSVIIFLEKTKKPITLTAGGFVTLSLTTLTSILRSSYSYFAVLRRMYSDS